MLWVAEVGSAHKGSPSLAYEFIRRFSEAGASVIKFQFGWTKEAQKAQELEYNPARYVDEWAPLLKSWCKYFEVGLMASIWSMDGLEAAKSIRMHPLKIGARMKDEKLIDACYDYLHEIGYSAELYRSGRGIYCVSEYPTYPPRLNMPDKFFGTVWGYSDHTHGIEACLLAAARGARYIEKHVCLDKSDLITKDTPFSATPDEYEQMVKLGNGIERLINA